jgi:asparagine synthase (glutamine-hydrolysing)
MCGILGLYDPSGVEPISEVFAAALYRMRRRGPDDSGTWSDECVILGHRRLSIVDLSSAGHQPMESSDKRYIIVFNGEIYNHEELRGQLKPHREWRSTSDTETLIEAYRGWGVDCLSRLNGMFAFAIWDRSDRTLFLARDRMGVKPLYYAERNGQFMFASRPGALSALFNSGSISVNLEALRVYLELGYVPAPLSFVGGTQKLQAGHYLLVNSRGIRRVRYWDFRAIAPDRSLESRPEGELIEELDALLKNAVKLRLLSDVPLGAFLSSGTDSSLVVALMKAAGVEHPRAFTVAFKEPEFDEGAAAADIARILDVDHIIESLDIGSLVGLLPTYAEEFDEPFADSSAFPTMALARLTRRHVTVALSGDGADELFGGYHYYPAIERMQELLRLPPGLRQIARRALQAVPSHQAKLIAGALGSQNTVELFNFMRGVGKDYPALLREDAYRSTSGSLSWFEQCAAGFAIDLTDAEIGMRLDAGITLPDLFLNKVDVATMAYSLEVRCPMTDYRVVEWAMRLPIQFKLRSGGTKYLLKKTLSRYLPEPLIYRPKMGFGVPIAQWLRGPLKGWASDLIHDETVLSRLPLDTKRVRQLFEEQQSGRRESHPLLWSVLMLLCFMRAHGSPTSIPAADLREIA